MTRNVNNSKVKASLADLYRSYDKKNLDINDILEVKEFLEGALESRAVLFMTELNKVLDKAGMNKADIARELDITPQGLHSFLSGSRRFPPAMLRQIPDILEQRAKLLLDASAKLRKLADK